ncbi:hypothetical protein C1646_773617 [Rhizophagus diaphanus]|nr:hypothetical protein C1646_773617 [Rhizophagus diaphanus] [Rhizophagus sp. MUCL 43196]
MSKGQAKHTESKDDYFASHSVYFSSWNEVTVAIIYKIDNSDEIVIISTNIALKSLETVNMFLLQQEDTDEYIKLVGKIEKFY